MISPRYFRWGANRCMTPAVPSITGGTCSTDALQKSCQRHTRRHQCAPLCSVLPCSRAVLLAMHCPAQRPRPDERNEVEVSSILERCQALATSRGNRLNDGEYKARAVMMFIEGCIMGRQR